MAWQSRCNSAVRGQWHSGAKQARLVLGVCYSKTRAHASWKSMRNRCYNQHDPNFHHYGGRGIIVCARWLDSYLNFWNDMGERPPGMVLDRIDTNGNYEPDNCRWATYRVSAFNRRCVTSVIIDGESPIDRKRRTMRERHLANPEKFKRSSANYYAKNREVMILKSLVNRAKRKWEFCCFLAACLNFRQKGVGYAT